MHFLSARSYEARNDKDCASKLLRSGCGGLPPHEGALSSALKGDIVVESKER